MNQLTEVQRAYELTIGRSKILLPCFFPSISSVKTSLPPIDYLAFLTQMHFPRLLVSAYDLYHAGTRNRSEMYNLLHASMDNDVVILLDSGNYEAFWRNDRKWKIDRLKPILRGSAPQLAFHFDRIPNADASESKIVQGVERGVLSLQRIQQSATILPIVHGPAEALPALAREVARRLQPILVGVPERELGSGVLERAIAVGAIRKALNELGSYYPLHLLGTGNPLSLLIYAACGADSFDGLEWCQTSVDNETARLYHLHQWDFFAEQTAVATITGQSYTGRVLTHNLLFFADFMDQIRLRLQAGQIGRFIEERIPDGAVARLRSEAPAIFAAEGPSGHE